MIAGCASQQFNQSPKHLAIEQAFFKCDKCHSLEGGIYGKGPLKKLHSDRSDSCIHDWQRIRKAEFRQYGKDWNGIVWLEEIPFWSND